MSWRTLLFSGVYLGQPPFAGKTLEQACDMYPCRPTSGSQIIDKIQVEIKHHIRKFFLSCRHRTEKKNKFWAVLD